MMLKNLFLFTLISFSFFTLSAQQTINGSVAGDDGTPLAFANVLLQQETDSILVKGAITDENGNYLFENISPGNYIITASTVGFETKTTPPFQLGQNTDYTVPNIGLTAGLALDEVVVQTTKPLYVQKIDRMVINVESSIVSAGASALEVLERSPGVIVDRQNSSISLSGKSGVVVMINGKISYMPQDSLVQLLEGMSSDNIETIELITTPPANFDAEGNAGFINIVLKKRADLGLNGTYSLSTGIGNGTNISNNISFNYRKDKINLFGNYSFLRDSQGQQFDFSRSFQNQNNLPATLRTVSDRDPVQRNHNLRLGLDYQTSEKTVIGVLLSAYDNKWTMDALNNSIETENSSPISFVELITTERNQWQNFSSNLNFKHNFTDNKFISFDLDYLHYYDENPTDYVNSFFDGNNSLLREELTNSDKTTPINIVVGKVDYSNQLNDNIKIETGVKAVVSNFENDVSVATFDGQAFVEDPTLTNKSNLDERILAAYSAMDYKLSDKTSFKLGLRYEHTDSELDTETGGRVVDREFGKLFPSVFVSHAVNDSLSFNASYSKRITRPTFNNLAPFVIFLDPTTFISGNSALQPSISNALKFDTNYRNILLSFQYTIQDEPISNFQERFDDATGRLFFEAANNDESRLFTITLGLPINVVSWWKMQNNFIYQNTQVDAVLRGDSFSFEQNSFNANSSQTFTIAEDFTAEINLNYFGPGLFGIRSFDGVFGMNIGFQKKFGDKWGTLRFSVNDVLESFEFTGRTTIPEQNLNTVNTFDFSNRTFTLTYSRNFGNSKLKSARQRGTGSDEERRRVN
ncbi:TonB-dependent receptor domain-containing protein [Spongiimicrobium sp. 3-5]|uniref:TonB-dependent receptor domain-containing protein n=1 Tax=Spongiimicrobium sp. 3-5 TaxID=3332596 RepID=UPI0039807801